MIIELSKTEKFRERQVKNKVIEILKNGMSLDESCLMHILWEKFHISPEKSGQVVLNMEKNEELLILDYKDVLFSYAPGITLLHDRNKVEKVYVLPASQIDLLSVVDFIEEYVKSVNTAMDVGCIEAEVQRVFDLEEIEIDDYLSSLVAKGLIDISPRNNSFYGPKDIFKV